MSRSRSLILPPCLALAASAVVGCTSTSAPYTYRDVLADPLYPELALDEPTAPAIAQPVVRARPQRPAKPAVPAANEDAPPPPGRVTNVGSLQIGDEAFVVAQSADSGALVAATREAYTELCDAVAAGDREGVYIMVGRGLVWAIPHGTKCRVLDVDLKSYRVRILSGEHYGRSGFVRANCLQRKGAR